MFSGFFRQECQQQRPDQTVADADEYSTGKYDSVSAGVQRQESEAECRAVPVRAQYFADNLDLSRGHLAGSLNFFAQDPAENFFEGFVAPLDVLA